MVISTFFFSIMLLFSFPYLVVRQIDWVIFILRFTWSLTPMLIFALFFIWRLIWGILNLLGRSLMDWETFLFLGNSRQYRLVCTKTISSWVKKVLCIAKAHMSLGFLWGAAACPYCTSCRQVTWPEFLHQVDTAFVPTLLLQIGTKILYIVPCWAPVSSCCLGRCQTLTYRVWHMLGYWTIALPSTKQIASQLSVQC